MSSYVVTSSATDLLEDPEILLTNFLKNNWSDITSGVKLVNIDFGIEPGDGTKPFIIKVEENFTDINGIDIADHMDQFDFIMDVHIWALDSKKKSTLGYTGYVDYRWKMRLHIERLAKLKRNDMVADGIKHLYRVGAQNIREAERTDWHHAIVTVRMQTFKAMIP
jgi:hypothetical protein